MEEIVIMLKFSTINVTGPDAFEFLQGQLTNDLASLGPDTEILAAWCNPKGRVIWFGTVRIIDDGFSLSALAETADDIVRRLTVFRFRSKIEFSVVDEGVEVDPVSLVQNGYPTIGASQTEKFTPHMLNFDLLGAINFEKGCYTGQEIVARTHYKGATKRRTLRFESEGPVSEGDKVSSDDRDIGEVLNAHGNDLLAVVPVDKIDRQLSVGESKLTYVPLPYLEIMQG
jgi:folate-binding protein YgfZ